MTPYSRKLVVGTFEILDLGLLTFALFAAAASAPLLFFEGMGAFTAFFTLRVKVVNVVLYILLLVVWHVIFDLISIVRIEAANGSAWRDQRNIKGRGCVCHGCLCRRGGVPYHHGHQTNRGAVLDSQFPDFRA